MKKIQRLLCLVSAIIALATLSTADLFAANTRGRTTRTGTHTYSRTGTRTYGRTGTRTYRRTSTHRRTYRASAHRRTYRASTHRRAGMRTSMHRTRRYARTSGRVPGVTLSAAQERRIAQIRRETRAREMAERRNTSYARAERENRAMAARREGHERVIAVLTPEQRARHYSYHNEQMNRVASRYGMTTRMARIPGVQVNAEQERSIAQVRRESQQRMSEARRDTNLTREERDRRLMEIRQEEHNRVLNILSPEQRAQFENAWQNRPEVLGR